MRNTGPVTFGARLASHPLKREEGVWFFNVPPESAGDTEPQQPEADNMAAKVQIGPLDV